MKNLDNKIWALVGNENALRPYLFSKGIYLFEDDVRSALYEWRSTI